MSKINKIFEKEVSRDFENKVFQAVLPELKKNKQSFAKKLSWILIPTTCLTIVIFTQIRTYQLESEMLTLSSVEVELYKDLDIIEDLEILESMDENSEDRI